MNEGVAPGALVERLRALDGAVGGLQSLVTGESLSGDDGQWDVGLHTTHLDRDALEAYRVDPRHQEVVAWIRENTSARTFLDFET